MDQVLEICKKYDIHPEIINTDSSPLGIGDILFFFLFKKCGLIDEEKLIFNIQMYSNTNYYFINNLNVLEFRIQLIQKLIKDNKLNLDSCKYTISNNSNITQLPQLSLLYKQISQTKLAFNTDDIILKTNITSFLENNKYIIFHTKCRQTCFTNYSHIKNAITNFTFTFKTKYKIIIMGEINPPNSGESHHHKMTTVYNELLPLSFNNQILDLTNDNYDTLNINSYAEDVKLIKNAECNISFGMGGSLCTSIVFGKKTYYYCCRFFNDNYIFDQHNINIKQFNDIEEMCNLLQKELI